MNNLNNKEIRIKELVKELNKYAYEYYTLDKPSVDDSEYDSKYDELVLLEKETGIIIPDSPTQRIGDKVLDCFEKITHKNKLFSLDKAYSYEELKAWDNLMNKIVHQHNLSSEIKLPKPKYVVMKKFDGLTINSQYDNSKLQLSATRGNGKIGEIITEQSKTIINLPKIIAYSDKISVHGEVLMTKRAFDEYNKKAINEGKSPLKNLRNGASGSIRNLNIKECAKRKLIVRFYDITDSTKKFVSLSDKLDFMQQIGLPVTEYITCDNIEDVFKQIESIKNQRQLLPYDIDGVVIKIDDLNTCKEAGHTIKFPKFAKAYKFKAEEAETKILGIEWNVGRTGRVNPTAILESIELGGVVVNRATLNNSDFIIKKGIKIGCTVIVRRSGDVIPEITGVVVESLNNINLQDITIPDKCPSCGEILTRNGAFYICENTLGCKPQLIKEIQHFSEKQAMNIVGFSEKTAEAFIENNIINNIVDLYKIEDKKEEILKIDKFALKKYNNLIDSIQKSKQCKLNQFLYGLGIPEVGIKTAQDLAEHFKTIDNIEKASIEELLKVSDIGDIIAENIYNWFKSKKNIELLQQLISIVNIEDMIISEIEENPFTNKTVVVTGTLIKYSRQSIKDKLQSLGAKVTGSVSKKTNYVIVGTDAGSKADKAIELGITTISEEEFELMIR